MILDDRYPNYDDTSVIDSNGHHLPRKKCPPKTYTDVYCDPVAENKQQQ